MGQCIMSGYPQRAQSVFLAVLEQPLSARDALLDRQCAGDAELRQRVEALLEAHDEPGSFLNAPPVGLVDYPTIVQPMTEKAGTSGELGDFRILREIGRGGMGVVYEAQQISLGRQVALKVLPYAAMLDARQLKRFKNEAQAAASLHHTNIVPVYAVGSERGVHYYAMQYIEGQTLDRVIAALRQSESRRTSAERKPVALPPAAEVQADRSRPARHRRAGGGRYRLCRSDARIHATVHAHGGFVPHRGRLGHPGGRSPALRRTTKA